MQKQKNIRLIISLLVLTSITLFVALYEPPKQTTNTNARLFMVQDTAQIDRLVLNSIQGKNELVRTPEGWQLNGKYKVDPNLTRVFLAVLDRVRVTRPVAKVEQDKVKKTLEKDGVRVEVYSKGDLVKQFYSGGNATQTESYFMEDSKKEAYVVALPGYKSYVSGLFALPESDWRDRTVFKSNWQSIQKVAMEYFKSPEQSFEIVFKEQFFEIPGVSQLDTAAMFTYLQLFQYIPADQVIEAGENKAYDSLKNTQPWFTLQLNSLDQRQNNSLTVYPKIRQDNSYLGVDKEGQMLLFNRKKISALARKKRDFVR